MINLLDIFSCINSRLFIQYIRNRHALQMCF